MTGGGLPDTVSLSDLGGSFAGLPPTAVRPAYAASTLAVQAIVDRVGYLAVTALLADLSASFVNLPSEQIELQIDSSLKMLVEFLGNDRSTLVEFGEDAHIRSLSFSTVSAESR